MATVARTFARGLRTKTRASFVAAPRATFRRGGRRFYSSESGTPSGPSSTLWWAAAAVAVGGGGYYLYNLGANGSVASKIVTPKFEDYQAVYDEIAYRLEADDYDDGSYGPVLVRLAWHASGTFDKETGTGGSNGATMRFSPESDRNANAGLNAARNFLEPIKGVSAVSPPCVVIR
jgi:cytochrome c peroxidase